MTDAERRAALEAIADEVRRCSRCRLHEGRTLAVPGEGSASTEVVFVGEGPGFNEDRQGRPFVGRAGTLLTSLLRSVGWRREDVFITNIVKCRPPDNRDPQPDEIAACEPFLNRQLQVLDPALVVTLGRHSMGRFLPGARISGVHGTARPVDPATGAANALVFAMYHPAAALRSAEVERQSYEDIGAVPGALLASRERRSTAPGTSGAASPTGIVETPEVTASAPAAAEPEASAVQAGVTASARAAAVTASAPASAEPARAAGHPAPAAAPTPGVADEPPRGAAEPPRVSAPVLVGGDSSDLASDQLTLF